MTDITVLMIPPYEAKRSGASGIDRVIEAYHQYLPRFGVRFARGKNASYDILAVHAGLTGEECDVAHLHGIALSYAPTV